MEYQLTDLSPIVKWAGGKEQELKYILKNLPSSMDRFVEPFVGGGAVYFAVDAHEKIINDKSVELINLYTEVKNNNEEFIAKLQNLQNSWLMLELFLKDNLTFFKNVYTSYKQDNDKAKLEKEIENFITKNQTEIKKLLSSDLANHIDIFEKELLRNIKSKLVRMKELEAKKGDLSASDRVDNFECALKGSFYMFIRTLHNHKKSDNIHYFYFMREYCYSSMFRYNAQGGFNVPYGGISYNKKNLQRKIDYIKSEKLAKHLAGTQIYNLDFREFLNKIKVKKNDFLFLDPPYDTDFNNYLNSVFGKEDQERLADFLINKCPAKFMLIIKNTEFIYNLYSQKGLYIGSFDKKYMVSFKNRNNKDCDHLIISNYTLKNSDKTITELESINRLQYA